MLAGARILTMVAVLAASNAAVADDNGLDFKVSVEKTEFVSGRPVIVRFSWTNTGEDEMSLREWGGPNVGVERIATVDGKPVHDFAIYRDGERLRYRGGWVDGLLGWFRLAPGQTESREYDVSRSYDLTAPGEYVLRAAYVRAIHPGEPERVDYVVHPEIAIVVVEGE